MTVPDDIPEIPEVPPTGGPKLTALGAGVILGVVALVVMCCLGLAFMSLFVPPPGH